MGRRCRRPSQARIDRASRLARAGRPAPIRSLRAKVLGWLALSKAPGAVSAAGAAQRAASGRRPRRSAPGGGSAMFNPRRSRPSRCCQSLTRRESMPKQRNASGITSAPHASPKSLRVGRASSCLRRRRGRRRSALVGQVSPGLDRALRLRGRSRPSRRGRAGRPAAVASTLRRQAAQDDDGDARSPTAWLWTVRWTTCAPCRSAGAKTVARRTR